MKTAKEIYMYVLGALIVICFFIVVATLLFISMPEKNTAILLVLLGALSAKFSDVIGYFFGSSKSSSDKNELLYNSTPTAVGDKGVIAQ